MKLSIFVAMMLSPCIVFAEALNPTYTEPAEALQDTSLWVCIQRRNTSQICTCTNFQRVVVTPDDDGATATQRSPSYNVPIRSDEVPLTVRWSATSRLPNGNETSPLDVTPVCQPFTGS